MTLRRLLGLLIGIAIFTVLFAVVDARRVGTALAGVDWGFAAWIPVLFLGIYFLQTLRFFVVLAPLHRLPSLWRTYQVVLSGVVVNTLSPGGGGDLVSRPYLMRHLFGIPAKTTFAATAAERLFDLVFLLLNGLVAAALIFPDLIVTVVAALALVGAGALFFFHVPLDRLPLPARLKKLWTDLRIVKTIPVRYLAAAGLLTALGWLILYATFALAGLAFHQRPSVILLAAFALSFIVGVLSLIPGGLGTNELSMSALLYAFGYPAALGVSIPFLVRLLNVAPAALASLPLLRDLARAGKRGSAKSAQQ